MTKRERHPRCKSRTVRTSLRKKQKNTSIFTALEKYLLWEGRGFAAGFAAGGLPWARALPGCWAVRPFLLKGQGRECCRECHRKRLQKRLPGTLQSALQVAIPGTLQADTGKQAVPVMLPLCKGNRLTGSKTTVGDPPLPGRFRFLAELAQGQKPDDPDTPFYPFTAGQLTLCILCPFKDGLPSAFVRDSHAGTDFIV